MDDCPITMRELAIVKATYVDLLRGAFHPRVQYPSPVQSRAAGGPTAPDGAHSTVVPPVADQAEETEEIGRPVDDGADAGPDAAVVERPGELHESVTAAE